MGSGRARVMITQAKRCRGCGLVKELCEYAPERRVEDGRQARCRKCERDRRRAWAAANRGYMRAISKQWCEDFPDRNRARHRRWYLANRDRYLAYNHRRRARLVGVESDGHTRSDVWRVGKARCWLCGCRLDKSDWHEDHVVPIALGGSNLLANCRPSCPPCNRSKGARLVPYQLALMAEHE